MVEDVCHVHIPLVNNSCALMYSLRKVSFIDWEDRESVGLLVERLLTRCIDSREAVG